MNPLHRPAFWRRAALLVAAGLALLVWGCGGVGTGGTGDYAESSVTGFGSIIVGDAEFDDGAASVVDDDGVALTRNGNEVRLGMTLEVQGSGASAGGSGRAAQTFRIATAVLGPVDAVDAAAGTLSMLGQQVKVRGSTVFGTPLRGLASVRVGDVLAVHGFAGANGASYLATRIEPAPGARAFRLRGVVSGHDPVSRTFRIGGATLSYALAGAVPATLADGQLVNARLSARSAGATLAVESFGEAFHRPLAADLAIVDGLVTSPMEAGTFSVNGMPVDARQAAVLPAAGAVTIGAFVSVHGSIADATLLASQVTVLPASAIDARVFKVSGIVSALDTSAGTFTVRNVDVDYGTAVIVGTPSALANGAAVQVEGPLSADGSRLRATQLTIR